EPLPSVVETQAALDGEGSDLFDDALGNVYFRREHRTDGLDEAFAAAAYVHRRSVHTNRYLAAPMEGRGIVAEPDPATGELVVRMSTQAPHVARTSFARALGLSETQVRVAAPAV